MIINTENISVIIQWLKVNKVKTINLDDIRVIGKHTIISGIYDSLETDDLKSRFKEILSEYFLKL
jgi:hypothetical protein